MLRHFGRSSWWKWGFSLVKNHLQEAFFCLNTKVVRKETKICLHLLILRKLFIAPIHCSMWKLTLPTILKWVGKHRKWESSHHLAGDVLRNLDFSFVHPHPHFGWGIFGSKRFSTWIAKDRLLIPSSCWENAQKKFQKPKIICKNPTLQIFYSLSFIHCPIFHLHHFYGRKSPFFSRAFRCLPSFSINFSNAWLAATKSGPGVGASVRAQATAQRVDVKGPPPGATAAGAGQRSRGRDSMAWLGRRWAPGNQCYQMGERCIIL